MSTNTNKPNTNKRLTTAHRMAARHAEAQREERREAMQGLLATPLLTVDGDNAEAFRLVRLHAEWLKTWFSRWPGWTLIVAADVARLRKHPSPHRDTTRGLMDKSTSSERTLFTRRRYALLCLVLGTLENEQRQTTIQQVATKTMLSIRMDPDLCQLEYEFDPKTLAHRRELVAVMRFLQRQQVLIRADGDDGGYVHGDGDCLYRIERTALSTILCSLRGASTIPTMPLEDFIAQLNERELPESPEAQNRELQHLLIRRLLDDPIMYYVDLTPSEFEYFNSQGERLMKELARTTGMILERRAEGVAMLDPDGGWTDLGLPETGTRGHATLLLAEWLGDRLRQCEESECRVPQSEVHAYVANLAAEHKSRWRKNADSNEGIQQILRDSIGILRSLCLLDVQGDQLTPQPAIARFRLGKLVEATERTIAQ